MLRNAWVVIGLLIAGTACLLYLRAPVPPMRLPTGDCLYPVNRLDRWRYQAMIWLAQHHVPFWLIAVILSYRLYTGALGVGIWWYATWNVSRLKEQYSTPLHYGIDILLRGIHILQAELQGPSPWVAVRDFLIGLLIDVGFPALAGIVIFGFLLGCITLTPWAINRHLEEIRDEMRERHDARFATMEERRWERRARWREEDRRKQQEMQAALHRELQALRREVQALRARQAGPPDEPVPPRRAADSWSVHDPDRR